MRAWVILKRETCNKCGTPYWLGHNPDNYIGFTVAEATCYACAKIERESKKEREPGTTAYPVLSMVLDAPRPTRAMWLAGERTEA